MHLFILFISLCITNLNIKYKTLRSEIGGNDERYLYNRTENCELLNTIKKNNYKMMFLNKLESSISTNEKIDLIENDIYTNTHNEYNIKAGGLMDDWLFEI